jgi:hypothetical protein
VCHRCPSEELFDEYLLSQVPLKLPNNLLDVFWGFDCMAPAGLAPRLFAWLKVNAPARLQAAAGQSCNRPGYARPCPANFSIFFIAQRLTPHPVNCPSRQCHVCTPPAELHMGWALHTRRFKKVPQLRMFSPFSAAVAAVLERCRFPARPGQAC